MRPGSTKPLRVRIALFTMWLPGILDTLVPGGGGLAAVASYLPIEICGYHTVIVSVVLSCFQSSIRVWRSTKITNAIIEREESVVARNIHSRRPRDCSIPHAPTLEGAKERQRDLEPPWLEFPNFFLSFLIF